MNDLFSGAGHQQLTVFCPVAPDIVSNEVMQRTGSRAAELGRYPWCVSFG